MKGRINFILPIKVKKQLEQYARTMSVEEKRTITIGEMMRRSIKIAYGFGKIAK
jgi:hypothetical protein